jgi:hypothetical protein
MKSAHGAFAIYDQRVSAPVWREALQQPQEAKMKPEVQPGHHEDPNVDTAKPLFQPQRQQQADADSANPLFDPAHNGHQDENTAHPLDQPDHRRLPSEETANPLFQSGQDGQTEKILIKSLFTPRHELFVVALVAAAAAVLLPFVTTLSGEKAVAAHLIGLVMAAVAAKSIWLPGRGDGMLLTGVGILGVLVPIFAWQMPMGAEWVLPMLSAIVAAAGCWHIFPGNDRRPTA